MKEIQIFYLDNGDIKNVYKKELIWKKLISEERSEAGELEILDITQNIKHAFFKNGTTIFMAPISYFNTRANVTHLYIDDEIGDLVNTNGFINYMENENLQAATFQVNDQNQIELKLLNKR